MWLHGANLFRAAAPISRQEILRVWAMLHETNMGYDDVIEVQSIYAAATKSAITAAYNLGRADLKREMSREAA